MMRCDDRGGEGAGEQLPLDRDVDDARALADHTAERTVDERHGERERAREQPDDRDRRAAAAQVRKPTTKMMM